MPKLCITSLDERSIISCLLTGKCIWLIVTISSVPLPSLTNPMGFENQALWQLDSEKSGMEKVYCCFASNAKDFARFGK